MSHHKHGRCSKRFCEFQPSTFRMFSGEGCGYSLKGTDEFLFGHCSKCDQFENDDNELCARCQHLRIRHLLTCGLEKIALEDNTSLVVEFQLTRGLKQRECAFCQVIIQSNDMKVLDRDEDKQQLEKQLETEDVCVNLTLGLRSEWDRKERWRNTFSVSFRRCSGIGSRHRAEDEDNRDKGNQNEAGHKDGDTTGSENEQDNYLGSGDVSFLEREPDPSTGRSALEMNTAGSVISWARIQKWLENGNPEEHNDGLLLRHGVSRMHLPADFMVIDIKKGCITKAPDGCKYAALSYVWGEPEHSNPLELTSANLQHLQKPGSLSGELVPATIHDALAVCAKLGIRYLWVDRLCIVQDGSSHKMSQINAMGSIYSTAYVTICAVAGANANYGLLGLDTRPRTIFPGGAQISGLVLAPCISFSASRSEMWWKRGWTYQEYLLSPRKLLFAETHVEMQCGLEFECEGPTQPGNRWEPTEWAVKSRFSAYTEFVEGYNERNLSHETDVYNAFLGIFERVYGTLDELLYGLPRAHFYKALLWHTFPIGDEPLPRVGDNDTKIPSWTWARARGRTTYQHNLHCYSPVALLMRSDESSLCPVSNAVTWERKRALSEIFYSFGDDNHAPSIYAFAAFSLVWEERREHTKLVFPQPLRKMESVLKEKWPQYSDYFKDLERAAIRRASPSQAAEHRELASRLAEPEKLAIWTSVAEVGLFPQLDEDDEDVSSFYLNDENGSIVGHAYFDLDVDQAKDRTSNQCIALSVGQLDDSRVQSMLHEDTQLGLKDAATYPPSEERDPFGYDWGDIPRRLGGSDVTVHDPDGRPLLPPPVINIMMIKWEAGVAYRVGLGWVFLTKWSKLNPSFATVILG